MKESRHFFRDAPIHIVDKGIKDASFLSLRNNVIISYYSWYQRAVSLFKKDFFIRATHADFTIAFYAHGDDKAYASNPFLTTTLSPSGVRFANEK